jgi:hypothetical protein
MARLRATALWQGLGSKWCALAHNTNAKTSKLIAPNATQSHPPLRWLWQAAGVQAAQTKRPPDRSDGLVCPKETAA